jgi:hypothetical protein
MSGSVTPLLKTVRTIRPLLSTTAISVLCMSTMNPTQPVLLSQLDVATDLMSIF